ncbi:MAG: 2-hydroxychromene-2-carboxylate isomerase [Gammaproteobacteria bacterium CG22_combo_CG10-13_8_21_14_all_40_8]|nr:MAG: 2-hydroxychromene-2-carboxylate isomerase [Gammaproteobacteria bacterium CG22_combo_CG10-13_8_21_14_all_40_8]
MSKQISWYFDFISPFAYLQLEQFKALPHDVVIEYKPVLLAGLLEHWKNIGPAEIKPKRIFTYQYCQWLAKKKGIPFKMPPAHPFVSLVALRLAIASNNDQLVIRTIFEAIWKEGLSLEDAATWSWLSKHADMQNAVKLMETAEVKSQLRTNTDEAAELQIFGVPTMHIDGHNFWGYDGFDMALDYLQQPKTFFDEEMQRIAKLPVGIQRKR